MIHAYRGIVPTIHPSAFVADSADVIGDVELAEDVGIWFNVVIRGDVNHVRIGRGANVQDGTVIHVGSQGQSTILEEYVTVGHGARLHGCLIASHCLVGIGAIVLDGAVLEEECLVAAGSVVTPGARIPRGSLLMGAPARVARRVTDADLELIRGTALNYIALKDEYMARRGSGGD